MKRKMRVMGLLLIVSLMQPFYVFAAEETGNINTEELEMMQWKEAANESLSQYGAKSPYYSTGQWNDPDAYMTVADFDWFNYKDYADYCDSYYGICLLKNVFNTSQVEANPSVGIDNVVDSELGYGSLPDFSNHARMYYPYENLGITNQDLAAIPLPTACISWRNPVDYEEDMLNYTLYFHNLIWNHKGSYNYYSGEWLKDTTGKKMMELRIIDASIGTPIGCHVTRASSDGTYGNKCYYGGIKKIEVKYPYAEPNKYLVQSTFSISFGPHTVKTAYDKYYDDVWTINFLSYPNEMDMQYLHGLLRLITPDAEEIYAAIKIDLYGDRDCAPWRYEDQNYMIGYAPWKYYDKWYDIGVQSRICSSYKGQTLEQAGNTGYTQGYNASCYIYRIAPRVGVSAPGYDIRR